VFIGIVFLPLLPAIGRNAAAWSGKRFDGTEISKNELNRALEEHKSWIDKTWEEPDQKEGNKLQLQGADLIGVQLNGIDLREADLNGANLTDAKVEPKFRDLDWKKPIFPIPKLMIVSRNFKNGKLYGS
jgi:uncharacterized protein YjbI with pentapeptide repeats